MLRRRAGGAPLYELIMDDDVATPMPQDKRLELPEEKGMVSGADKPNGGRQEPDDMQNDDNAGEGAQRQATVSGLAAPPEGALELPLTPPHTPEKKGVSAKEDEGSGAGVVAGVDAGVKDDLGTRATHSSAGSPPCKSPDATLSNEVRDRGAKRVPSSTDAASERGAVELLAADQSSQTGMLLRAWHAVRGWLAKSLAFFFR